MRFVAFFAAMIVACLATFPAVATPVDKAPALPLAVELEWASSHRLVNAIRLDCRIHDGNGKGVGRGSYETRIFPEFLSRRGTLKAVMPAVVYKGTDPEDGLKCDCRARFDMRSPFFTRGSGSDCFGSLPWMFARPIRFAQASCAPVPAPDEKTS